MSSEINPSKFGEGLANFEEYLSLLYKELDKFVGQYESKVPDSEYEKLRNANNEYKTAFEAGKEKMKGPISVIDGLLEKAKSGGVKTQEEAESLNKQIGEQYSVVVNIAVSMYALLDPEIDSSKMINSLYTKGAKQENGKIAIKGLDSKLFLDGCEILKNYFLGEEMIGRIKKKAA